MIKTLSVEVQHLPVAKMTQESELEACKILGFALSHFKTWHTTCHCMIFRPLLICLANHDKWLILQNSQAATTLRTITTLGT